MSNPAPDQLELVRAFVNTYDHEDGTEQLTDTATLTAWLGDHGLGAPVATARDLERARELREALRAVLQHHGGLELDPAAPRAVDHAAERAKLPVAFDDAQRDGTWSRLKACAAEDCQYAFYDRSRNRSAVWCDMKVCGNRQKVRSFRSRHT